MLDRETQISKYISYVLRHNPADVGAEVDEYGNIKVNLLLEGIRNKYGSFEVADLKKIVAEDNKGRYVLNVEKGTIRACQGHSIVVQKLEVNPRETPKFLYHGTKESKSDSILSLGIKSMDRQYVHLTDSKEVAKKRGTRGGEGAVILKVDTEKLKNKGYEVKCATNGVYLVEYVPVECIELEGA